MYLLFFLSFLVHFTLPIKQKILFGGLTFLVGLNLLYTMSRGAWLAFLGASIILTATKKRRLLVPLMILCTVVWLAAPEEAENRWDSSFAEDMSASVQIRSLQWRTFLPMMAQNPIIGVGFQKFNETWYERGYFNRPKAPHSSIISIGVEEGVIGLIFYFWILSANYRHASKLYKTSLDPLDQTLSLGLMGATVCLLILDVSGTRFMDGNLMLYYWILAGMTLNSRQDNHTIAERVG